MAASDEAELKVYKVTGEAAISTLFRYEIYLVSIANNQYQSLDISDFLGKEATLEVSVNTLDDIYSFTEGPYNHKFHGVIEEFRELDKNSLVGTHYRLTLVPHLAELARNRQSRIHATKATQNLATLIANKLTAAGDDYTNDQTNRAVLTSDEYDTTQISNTATDIPRTALSHVTQYNETDLDFIRRLCEYYGVNFLFKANTENDGAVVAFGNTHDVFSATETDLILKLRVPGPNNPVESPPAPGNTPTAYGHLTSFEKISRPCPKIVQVVDYDYKDKERLTRTYTPSSTTETGIYTDHSTHFSTEAEGDVFAKIRYQEIKFSNNYGIGTTNLPSVVPGYIFQSLDETNSWRATDGDKYLITCTKVNISLPRSGPSGVVTDINGEPIVNNFRNEFRCVDFDSTDADAIYRSPRVTPVPRLSGVYSAHIDASAATTTAAGKRPQIEADGAYRIAHKFDERATVDAGKHSTPVRKAEPYAGTDVGMHFPLKRDTEVMVTYRNGDPDQPIIAGALYTGDTANPTNPVTSANQTSHLIQTSSGALIEIDDASHNATTANIQSRVTLRSRNGSDNDTSYMRLGYPNKDREKSYTADITATSTDTQLQPYEGIYSYTSDNTYSRSLQTHLLSANRVIIHSGTENTEPDEDFEQGKLIINSDGGLDIDISGDTYNTYEGDIHTTVEGDTHVTNQGDTHITNEGDTHITYEGDVEENDQNNKVEVIGGAKTSVVGGAKTSIAAGLLTSVAVGISTIFQGGWTTKFFASGYASIGLGIGFTMKPQVQFTKYDLKAQLVSLEMKKIQAEIKGSTLKVDQSDLEAKMGKLGLAAYSGALIKKVMGVQVAQTDLDVRAPLLETTV